MIFFIYIGNPLCDHKNGTKHQTLVISFFKVLKLRFWSLVKQSKYSIIGNHSYELCMSYFLKEKKRSPAEKFLFGIIKASMSFQNDKEELFLVTHANFEIYSYRYSLLFRYFCLIEKHELSNSSFVLSFWINAVMGRYAWNVHAL